MRIEDLEWDDSNEVHVTRHGVSVEEIHQVFDSGPKIKKNKRGRSADYVAMGLTRGGRRVLINFVYDAEAKSARPISAWEV